MITITQSWNEGLSLDEAVWLASADATLAADIYACLDAMTQTSRMGYFDPSWSLEKTTTQVRLYLGIDAN